jgi:DNA-binding beta-propeller fold protein YncE
MNFNNLYLHFFGFFILLASCSSPYSTQERLLKRPSMLALGCRLSGSAVPVSECSKENSELFAYVLNSDHGSISIINLSSDKYLDADKFLPEFSPVKVGKLPSDLAVTADGRYIFVLNKGSDSIMRVDPVTFEIVEKKLEFKPERIILFQKEQGHDEAFISSMEQKAVYRVSIDGFEKSFPEMKKIELKDGSPVEMALEMDPFILFVSHDAKGYVSAVSLDDYKETKISIYPQCMDSIDNDNDGFTDGFDSSCRNPDDDDESVQASDQCNDKIDNDNDGKTDEDDPDCPLMEFSMEFLPECSDGIDNDNDGLTDYKQDDGCYGWSYFTESYHPEIISTQMALDQDGTFLYVPKTNSQMIAVIDAKALQRVDVQQGKNLLLSRLGIRDIYAGARIIGIASVKEDQSLKAFISTNTGFIYTADLDARTIKPYKEDSKSEATRPRLYVNDEEIDLTISTHPEYPSLGTMSIIDLSDGTDRKSYYGIVFDNDTKLELSEKWTLVYEGVVPGSESSYGYITGEGDFLDPLADFCRLGAAKGDHLIIKVKKACGEIKEGSVLEYEITEVREFTMKFSSGQPIPPKECFNMPFEYEIRLSGMWTVSGSKSGFLHNITSKDGECVERADKNARFGSRAKTASFKEGIKPGSCPPVPNSSEVEWNYITGTNFGFRNISFGFNIYPPCRIDENLNVLPEKLIRGTKITFTAISGNIPKSISTGGFPGRFTVHPDQKTVYMTGLSQNTIYEIDAVEEEIKTIYY